MTATDIDAGKFGQIRYNITQVTNGAYKKFIYDSNTNELKAIGPLNPGERYQVVIEATDGGGLASQAIVLVHALGSGVDIRPSSIEHNQINTVPENNNNGFRTSTGRSFLGHSRRDK